MSLSPEQQAEIEAQRAERQETRRVVAPGLENMLYEAVPVLDHGFVRVVDYMGDDAAIVQAARVSYGEGTRHVSDDRTLIRYLLRHQHTTPLEMAEVKLLVRVPMDTWRQWIRHRTASVNEYSTRYSIAVDACQATPADAWRKQAASNRQGSEGFFDEQIGAELTAENLAQVDVVEGESPGTRLPRPTGATLRAAAEGFERTAVTVIHFPLFGVVENVESLLDFLESCLGSLVVRVHVGMVLARQVPIRLTNFILRGVATQSESLVIIVSHIDSRTRFLEKSVPNRHIYLNP